MSTLVVNCPWGPVKVAGGHRRVVPFKPKREPEKWSNHARPEAEIRADLAQQLYEIEHRFWRRVRMAEAREKGR